MVFGLAFEMQTALCRDGCSWTPQPRQYQRTSEEDKAAPGGSHWTLGQQELTRLTDLSEGTERDQEGGVEGRGDLIMWERSGSDGA